MARKRFTAEQLEAAKQVSALEYAQRCGYALVAKGQIYQLKEHDSMVFEKNGRWHWNSQNLHGGAIEFLIHYENKSLVEAVLLLSEGQTIEYTTIPKQIQPKEIKKCEYKRPDKNKTATQAYHYLTKDRKIDGSLVQRLIEQGIIYENQKYHNVVFSFQDKNGVELGASLRSTTKNGSKFVGMADGSNRMDAYFSFGAEHATSLFVFEAPIDALSYATLQKIYCKNPSYEKQCYYFATGGVGCNNLIQFLQANSHFKNIYFCQDNDNPGHIQAKACRQKIEEEYPNKFYMEDHFPQQNGCDYNDELQEIYYLEQNAELEYVEEMG